MSNRLAVLAAVLVLVVVASAPALAQDEVPTCELDDACLDTSERQEAANQYTENPEPGQAPSVPPTPEVPSEDSKDDQYTPNTGNTQNSVLEATLAAPASCGSCGLQAAQSAQDAFIGGGSGGTDSADTFGAVLQAARDAGGTRDAAASEEAGTPMEDTAVYRAAFEAAKKAGADDETAKEAAEQAVGEADSGSVAKGKDSKESAGEDKAREDKTEEEEEEEEDLAATYEENGGNDSSGFGDGDTGTAPADNRSPLLLGGVAFLSVGGFAALRFARS